jgi:quercetin dioxygenase-like cupin family protein
MPVAQTQEPAVTNMEDLPADTTVHDNVEVREFRTAPGAPHLAHVTIHGEFGARIEGTVHPDEHESVVVLRGPVIADIDGVEQHGETGAVFDIPPGVVHGYRPARPITVTLLATYHPAPAGSVPATP